MASGITISLGSSRANSAPAQDNARDSTTERNGTKRSHASLDDDSDNEGTPSKQVITHFDSKGAYGPRKPIKKDAPLVIQPQANRDWREASKAAKADRRARHGPTSKSAENEAKSREEELKRLENAHKPTFGLNVKSSVTATDDDNSRNESAAASEGLNRATASDETEQTAPKRARTDDERALDALLGIKDQSDLTIPAATEEEAFQRDFKDAPPMATLEQYAAVPVEQFGAALLRGMGWKEGNGIGNQSGQKFKQSKIPERRPALLGIGAKEDAAIKEEMGAWGRGAKSGRSELVYNPVVLRNKRTGEEITEDELRAKLDKHGIRDRDIEHDAHVTTRKQDDHDQRKSSERPRTDEFSDEEYERRRREKRRERERRDRDSNRRDQPRSRDANDRRDRDRYETRRERDSDRPRDRDREEGRSGHREQRRDRDDRDDRDRHRRTDRRVRDRSRDRDSDHDRRRRH